MYSNNAILVLQWTHSMDSIWTPHGLAPWTPSGLAPWTPYGLAPWTPAWIYYIPYGVHMESMWSPYGMVLDSIWNGALDVDSIGCMEWQNGWSLSQKSFHGVHMDSIWINPGSVKTSTKMWWAFSMSWQLKWHHGW